MKWRRKKLMNRNKFREENFFFYLILLRKWNERSHFKTIIFNFNIKWSKFRVRAEIKLLLFIEKDEVSFFLFLCKKWDEGKKMITRFSFKIQKDMRKIFSSFFSEIIIIKKNFHRLFILSYQKSILWWWSKAIRI